MTRQQIRLQERQNRKAQNRVLFSKKGTTNRSADRQGRIRLNKSNRKETKGCGKQTVYSEPRKKFLFAKEFSEGKKGKRVVKNVYSINPNARPVTVVSHYKIRR